MKRILNIMLILKMNQKYREKLLYYGNNYEKEYLNEKNARKLRKKNY